MTDATYPPDDVMAPVIETPPEAQTVTPPAAPHIPVQPFSTTLDRFVHLHVHSDFSLLDGLNGPYTLVRTAGHIGQPAIALTDHKRVSGAVGFWSALAWYNGAHAERHEYNEKSCKAAGCHSVAECADFDIPEDDLVHDGCGALFKDHIAPIEAHAKLAPIRGILGIETYVAHNGHGRGANGDATGVPGDRGHLILLAKNETGWTNIQKLESIADTEGFYEHPRIDMEQLAQYHEGIIVMSSCLGGHIAYVRSHEGDDAALAMIARYRDTMGPGNYFLELQWHNDQDLSSPDPGHHEQHDHNKFLIDASEKLGVPCVMANDLHYAWRKDAPIHEILLAISQGGKTLEELKQLKASGRRVMGFDTPDYFIKTRIEMSGALANWLKQARMYDPEVAAIIERDGRSWLDRTLEIADSVTLHKPFNVPKIDGLQFPQYPIPDEYMNLAIVDEKERVADGAKKLLAHDVWEGAKVRYGDPLSEKVRRQVAYEFQCIEELGFAPYFLITADFCKYARDENISVGKGRGSAPGSIITYATRITAADPIKYGMSASQIGLTRFLNPVISYYSEDSDFGNLPEQYRVSGEDLPSWQAMVDEIKAALNERAVARNQTFKDGSATDFVTGAPYTSDRLEFERRRWMDHLNILRKEWEFIQDLDKSTRDKLKGTVVPTFWRWLRYAKATGARGDNNILQSNLAPFLGLTSVRPDALMPEGEVTLLPHYHFAQSRLSMPDIDIDFSPGPNGRDKVMRYVREKYGHDHVCQIATFGKLLAKSALRYVAKVKGYSQEEINELLNLIPKAFDEPDTDEGGGDDDDETPKVTLRQMVDGTHPAVVEGSKAMREAMARDPRINDTIRAAARIEGTRRNVGVHACGVLITPKPITEYVTVEMVKHGHPELGIMASYDGESLTGGMGLLKADFLGLKNLKILDFITDRIFERTGTRIDLEAIPDDDPKAMRIFWDKRTVGIFQFAGFGGTVAKQIKPKRVQDLMDATALARPGPMKFIPQYLEARAAGVATYGDLIFAKYAPPILGNTYGILVYQEQMMRLAVDLAGFTLTESDALRKACAKKKPELLVPWEAQFAAGAVSKGVNEAWIKDWWKSTVVPMSAYAFNFSHSCVYGLTAYDQAWLKAYYPVEFLAGLGTVEQTEGSKETGKDKVKPLAKVLGESRLMGFKIVGIDINRSTDRIEIEGDDTLRVSMRAISGIGGGAVDAILAERNANGPFVSFADFLHRCTEGEQEINANNGRKIPRAVNESAVEKLIKCGAFDVYDDRQALLDRTVPYFKTKSVKKRAEVDWTPVPESERHLLRGYLDWEAELLGFFGSAHPVDTIPQSYRDKATDTVAEALEYENVRDREERNVVGVVSKLMVRPTRNGGERVVGTLEDATGQCQFTYWRPRPDASVSERRAYQEFKAKLEVIPREAVHFIGGFSFNEKWDKNGGTFSVQGFEEIILPGMKVVVEEPPKPSVDPGAKTRAEVGSALDFLAPDTENQTEGLDTLFG